MARFDDGILVFPRLLLLTASPCETSAGFQILDAEPRPPGGGQDGAKHGRQHE